MCSSKIVRSNMLQAALSCIDDAALALDEHGNVLDCNAQAEALGLAGMNAAKLRSAMTDTELRNFDDQQHPLTGALQGQRFDEIRLCSGLLRQHLI